MVMNEIRSLNNGATKAENGIIRNYRNRKGFRQREKQEKNTNKPTYSQRRIERGAKKKHKGL